jgi:hypothetical protein
MVLNVTPGACVELQASSVRYMNIPEPHHRPPRANWVTIQRTGKYRSSQGFQAPRTRQKSLAVLDMPARMLYIAIFAGLRRNPAGGRATCLLLFFQSERRRRERKQSGRRHRGGFHASKQAQDMNRDIVCQLNHKTLAGIAGPDYTYYTGFPPRLWAGALSFTSPFKHGAFNPRSHP